MLVALLPCHEAWAFLLLSQEISSPLRSSVVLRLLPRAGFLSVGPSSVGVFLPAQGDARLFPGRTRKQYKELYGTSNASGARAAGAALAGNPFSLAGHGLVGTDHFLLGAGDAAVRILGLAGSLCLCRRRRALFAGMASQLPGRR